MSFNYGTPWSDYTYPFRIIFEEYLLDSLY